MPLNRVLFAIALSTPLLAQNIAGTWQGTLQPLQGNAFRVVAKITQAADNKLAASVYNVDQPGQPLVASVVTFQGGTLKFTLPANGANYEGRLSADGNALNGSLTQGPQPIPLNVVRATTETAWEIPPPPPPPKSMDPAVDPAFEVATIKPTANPQRVGSNINVTNAGMFVTGNTSLKELIIFAYGVHPSQLQGLPAWTDEDKYDISAKPDHEGMGNDVQIRSMMKKLITERFGLKFHREPKELSAYTLNIGRTGQHKLTPNTSGVNLPGFGGRGPGSIGVRNSTMEQFAGFLQARIVDRPVVDKTGLAGKFDFTLTWRPDQLAPQAPNAPAPPADLESRPDIFGAMQEQLGLRFQAEKTPIEVLVIDAVSKPSEN
jgi:uncharacterized protein (TIGR03435 family)